MMFDFEEGYALFDMTPVDNQFIQEYLPAARGDDVRVYLYGLMRCYHPDNGMSLKQMSQDLGLTEEEVGKAFRYWERRGLVQRISDDPAAYRYVSLRRKTVSGAAASIDPAYEAFADSLYEVFDHGRRLHGSEIQTCYEWVEELGLQPEVVIMLMKHMEKKKGKNFSIRSAQQMAMQMAEEDVRTPEAAEEFFSRDQELYQGTRAVLKRLGKRNLPSEDQIDLYRKWVREWGFTHEAVMAACGETAKGDPSMGYLDAILRNTRDQAGKDGIIDEAGLNEAREEKEKLRKVLRAAGAGPADGEKQAWYRALRQEFSEEMILLAAEACKGRPLEDTGAMLRSWQGKGIGTPAEAKKYIREFRAQSELMRKMREMWGLRGNAGSADRATVTRWEKELGFSPEAILFAAEAAAGTERPMAYLNRILSEYADRGIRTREQIEAERKQHQDGKAAAGARQKGREVAAQQYEQRDYSDPGENPDDVLERLEGLMKHA